MEQSKPGGPERCAFGAWIGKPCRKRGDGGEGRNFRAKRFGAVTEGGSALVGELPGGSRPPQHGWWKPRSLMSGLDAQRTRRLVITSRFPPWQLVSAAQVLVVRPFGTNPK